MSEDIPVKFKPGFFVNKAGSQIEIRWESCPEIAEWLNKDVTIFRDRKTAEIIGCEIPIPQELTLTVEEMQKERLETVAIPSEHLEDATNYLLGPSQTERVAVPAKLLEDTNDYLLRMERGLRKITAILGPSVEQYPVEDPRSGIACEAGMALEVAQEVLGIKPEKE